MFPTFAKKCKWYWGKEKFSNFSRFFNANLSGWGSSHEGGIFCIPDHLLKSKKWMEMSTYFWRLWEWPWHWKSRGENRDWSICADKKRFGGKNLTFFKRENAGKFKARSPFSTCMKTCTLSELFLLVLLLDYWLKIRLHVTFLDQISMHVFNHKNISFLKDLRNIKLTFLAQKFAW